MKNQELKNTLENNLLLNINNLCDDQLSLVFYNKKIFRNSKNYLFCFFSSYFINFKHLNYNCYHYKKK